jgi:hypothetical protein
VVGCAEDWALPFSGAGFEPSDVRSLANSFRSIKYVAGDFFKASALQPLILPRSEENRVAHHRTIASTNDHPRAVL